MMRRTAHLVTILSPLRTRRGAQLLPQCVESYKVRRSAGTIENSCSNRRPDRWHPSRALRQLAGGPSRRSFSSDTTIPVRYSNDGLIRTLVSPHLESIRQLPEVDNALEHWDDAEAFEDIERAIQVFEMMQTGGPLHVAVIVLLVECFQHKGNYKEASRVLQTLQQLTQESGDETRFLIDFALAKSSWYQGNFDNAMDQINRMTENNASHDSNISRACVMNAEGIVRLMNTPNDEIDGGNSVVQLLRTAAGLIEKDSHSCVDAALVSASTRGNLGVAMVASGLNKVDPELGTLDEALCVFRDALDLLDQKEPSSSFIGTANTLRTHLYCNMAWTLLQQEDELKLASEYSSTALSFAEKLQNEVSEQDYHRALGRSLRLVASCYARADSALTAEGLFHSAIDSLQKASRDPLALLDLRDAHKDYAVLLHQWDKRSRDAEIQEEKCQATNESLPEGWKDKSSICSALDFITP